MSKLEEWPDSKKFAFMGIMLLTGSINTIANKEQQIQEYDGIRYEVHQKFITFCMFLGMTLCLLFYAIQSLFKKKKKTLPMPELPIIPGDVTEEAKNKDTVAKPTEVPAEEVNEPKYWMYFFPAFCDLLGSSLQTIGLTFVATSIYQMFRGAIIIFTAGMSFIFLKRRYYRHHFLGMGLVVGGLILVGVSAVIHKSGSSPNPGLGIVLIVIGQLFSSGTMILEEKILKGYTVLPLKACGCEGSWGAMTYLVLLFIFYFIKCDNWKSKSFKDKVCSDDKHGHFRFENGIQALHMIFHNWKLACFALLYICSIAFFNFAGISVTKYVSATARTVVDTCRTLIIWVFFLLPFHPTSLRESFQVLQLIGFIIVVIGGIIYNEIIEIPFLNLNMYTKKRIAERNLAEKLNEEKQEKVDEEKDQKPNEEKGENENTGN